MSKTGNSPLPRPPIHPQPNTNDGRQILDQQENVSHRCFPRRAPLKRPQRGLNPLPNSRPSPPFQAPSNPSLFCFFHRHVLPETQFANPSSMPVSAPHSRHRRITPQIRLYHVPEAQTSLIFRAFLIINLLVLWNRGYTAFFSKAIKMKYLSRNYKPIGELQDKRSRHTTTPNYH